MSSFYGTVPLVAGVKAIADVGAGGLSGLLIGNESGLTLTISLQGTGFSKSLYPGTVDWFPIPSGQSFNGNVVADNQSLLNNVGQWPSSFIQIDTYGIGEYPTGTYPMALPRTITGAVNSTVTATNAINNTGNAPLSNWLTVEPNDAVAATFSGDTSGNFSVSSDNAGVLTTLLQLIAGASPAVKIAAASIVAEVLGGLTVDGTFLAGDGKIGHTASADIIDASGADTSLKVRGATNAIHLQAPAGTDVATFAYNQITFNQGLQMANGHIIQFNIGQIKDLNNGSNLSGTINHGLTGTPAAVLVTCNTASSSATVGASSYTTTQFTLTVGGALNGRWVAYR